MTDVCVAIRVITQMGSVSYCTQNKMCPSYMNTTIVRSVESGVYWSGIADG
jgi:hypothetical protein